jgi:hypothetical protein
MAMTDRGVSQKMADWIIDELRWKAGIYKETELINVYNGGVVKSDVAGPESIKMTLQEEADDLENVPGAIRDWHPGSNEQVLNLVHPSLYPLVYGHTRVIGNELIRLETCIESVSKGDVISLPSDAEINILYYEELSNYDPCLPPSFPLPYSRNFQWLLCEVDISKEDGSAT